MNLGEAYRDGVKLRGDARTIMSDPLLTSGLPRCQIKPELDQYTPLVMYHVHVRLDIPTQEGQDLEAFDDDEDFVKVSGKSFQVGSLVVLYVFLGDTKSDNVLAGHSQRKAIVDLGFV